MDESGTQKLKGAIEWLKQAFAGIRTGQATPTLLDGVRVESYGTFMPIPQLGSVGIEDARTLRIVPWDASQVTAVEKALREADLGVSVMTDSAGLRIVFPELTGERRTELIKLAKSKLEEARVTVRGIRDELMKAIDAAEKSGDISQDEKFTKKEQIQSAIDTTNRTLEAIFAEKEQEISR